jgi:outer membrane biosynthesis protein TonB
MKFRKTVTSVSFALVAVGLGCSKTPSSTQPAPPPPAADPVFDSRWTALANDGVEALYIEDDQAQGLMGSVRRAAKPQPAPPPPPAEPTLPEEPPNTEIQRVVRGNMSAVKVCYMSMTRAGISRSGKAIVTFDISPEGAVVSPKVDAPAFSGTALPGCVMGQVARWSFPRSQKGGSSFSYPFVFVGG